MDKLHAIDLVDGRFADTSRQDLKDAFANLSSSGKKHLVVHFHGGLVSRQIGLQAAANLTKNAYVDPTYPLYFIWNSDILSVLRADLQDIAAESLFTRVRTLVTKAVVAKLGDSTGARAGKLVFDEFESERLFGQDAARRGVAGTTDALLAALEPVDAARTDALLTAKEEKELVEWLSKDKQLADIENGIAKEETPPEAAPALQSRAAQAKPVRSRLSPRIKREIVDSANQTVVARSEARGFVSTFTLVRYVVKIVAGVLKRYWQRTDHGFLATIVEEIVWQLYLDKVGSYIWGAIKADTEEAFTVNADVGGGAAFIEELKIWWTANPDAKVTLVGHSTGAIYIGHLLTYSHGELPPQCKFNVIFLAGAVTIRFVHERLATFKARVDRIRSFALSDALERGYWEVPGLYPASLLYMVSGICEPEVDTPLVGMQRYFSGQAPYDSAYIREVAAYLGPVCVWSNSIGTPGSETEAMKHGAFDNEPTTLASLNRIVTQGF